MSLADDKQVVMSEIAALRAKSKGYLNKGRNSMDSVNNKTNSMSFLIDLLKALEDINEMKGVIIETIIYQSASIELEIKKNLKKVLKEISVCTANPNIPSWAFSTGVDFKVDKIDYLDIFKVAPDSEIGGLYFLDNASGVNSTDFNTYLSNVIIQNGGEYSWGNTSPVGKEIVKTKFNQFGSTVIKNNTINTRISNNYVNSKLSKFNDDYVDSLNIISAEALTNALLDSFSGVISFKGAKGKGKLKSIEEINKIIDKLVNTENEISVSDNSFFEFTNEDNINIDDIVNNKSKGVFKIDVTEEKVDVSLDYDEVVKLNNGMSATNNKLLKSKLLGEALDGLGLAGLENLDIDAINLPVIKLNIIEQIVNNLTRVLINQILSPKILYIFLLNMKIVYGEDLVDVITFIKKNVLTFKTLVNIIKPIIIKIILDRVIKKVNELIADKIKEISSERARNSSLMVQSLVMNSFDINDLL